MTDVLLAIAVFIAAAGIDYANTRFVQAVGENSVHRAARWSVVQWCAGVVGFIIIIKHSMWMLPAEAAGLYFGTYMSMRPRRNMPVES